MDQQGLSKQAMDNPVRGRIDVRDGNRNSRSGDGKLYVSFDSSCYPGSPSKIKEVDVNVDVDIIYCERPCFDNTPCKGHIKPLKPSTGESILPKKPSYTYQDFCDSIEVPSYPSQDQDDSPASSCMKEDEDVDVFFCVGRCFDRRPCTGHKTCKANNDRKAVVEVDTVSRPKIDCIRNGIDIGVVVREYRSSDVQSQGHKTSRSYASTGVVGTGGKPAYQNYRDPLPRPSKRQDDAFAMGSGRVRTRDPRSGPSRDDDDVAMASERERTRSPGKDRKMNVSWDRTYRLKTSPVPVRVCVGTDNSCVDTTSTDTPGYSRLTLTDSTMESGCEDTSAEQFCHGYGPQFSQYERK